MEIKGTKVSIGKKPVNVAQSIRLEAERKKAEWNNIKEPLSLSFDIKQPNPLVMFRLMNGEFMDFHNMLHRRFFFCFGW